MLKHFPGEATGHACSRHAQFPCRHRPLPAGAARPYADAARSRAEPWRGAWHRSLDQARRLHRPRVQRGNKVRQIEFHFGEAEARGADTVLVTGAVQSNLVRIAAASARRLGMEACILAPIDGKSNVPVRFSGQRTPPPHRLRRDRAVRVPEPHVGTGTRRRKRVERNRARATGPGAGRGDPGVSKLLITNILMRLIEEPRPAPLPPPLALKLVNEPLANTQHYDRLREKSHTD